MIYLLKSQHIAICRDQFHMPFVLLREQFFNKSKFYRKQPFYKHTLQEHKTFIDK